eukprot:2038371-Prymnesium_polylepis.1
MTWRSQIRRSAGREAARCCRRPVQASGARPSHTSRRVWVPSRCVRVWRSRCDRGAGAHGGGVAEADAAAWERASRLVGRAGGDGGETVRRVLHAGELVAERVAPVHVDAGVGHLGQ